MRAQVLNLLLSGASRETILSATGISSVAYDAILADPEFITQMDAAREERRETRIENSYGKLELTLVNKLTETAATDFLAVQDLCRMVETVARTRQLRRTPTAAQQNANHFQNPTVGITINLPSFLNSHVVLDSNKQVVAIDGRNMAPLPTEQVHNLFNRLNEASKGLEGNENEQETDPILADYAREIERTRDAQAA